MSDRRAISRRDLLRVAAAGGAAFGLGALGAACAPTSTTGPSATAATTAQATPQPTPSISTDRLTVISPSEVTTLDVHVRGREVLDMIHDTLTTRDVRTLQVAPHLATSWTRPDPLTWEFKLRSGVTFHNGEPFNAQTVKFNFERVIKPEIQSSFGASIRGVLDKVEVVDPQTVRIKTKTPYGIFLERLMTIRMVPEKHYSSNTQQFLESNPVGSGPYKFVEWVRGQRVVLERNDGYWGTKPVFKQLVLRSIPESSTRVAELVSGNAQIVYDIPPDQTDAVQRAGNADIRSTPNVQCLEIRFDSIPRGDKNPFTDKRVRHAAAYAVDKEAIAKNLMGGFAKVQATNIGPMMFGHDPSVQPFPYDPAKAKQLLAEAGHPNGFEVRFVVPPVSGFPTARQVAEAVSSDLGKVGIKATLVSVPQQEFTAMNGAGKAGPMLIGANQNGGFFDGGFGFFYLRKQFTASYYYSDDLEKKIVQIEGADTEERKRLLSEVQKELREQQPYMWGWSGFDLLGVDKRIALDVYPDFPRLHLAKPK